MNKVFKIWSIQACVCILLVTTVLTMAQDLSTIPSDTDDTATARDSFAVDKQHNPIRCHKTSII